MFLEISPKMYREISSTIYGNVPTNHFYYLINNNCRIRIDVGNGTCKQYTIEKRKPKSQYDICNTYCDVKNVGQSFNLYSAIQKANVRISSSDMAVLNAIDSNRISLI